MEFCSAIGKIGIDEVEQKETPIDSTDCNLIKLKDPDESLGRFEERLMGNVFKSKSASVLISDLKGEFYIYSLQAMVEGKILPGFRIP